MHRTMSIIRDSFYLSQEKLDEFNKLISQKKYVVVPCGEDDYDLQEFLISYWNDSHPGYPQLKVRVDIFAGPHPCIGAEMMVDYGYDDCGYSYDSEENLTQLMSYKALSNEIVFSYERSPSYVFCFIRYNIQYEITFTSDIERHERIKKEYLEDIKGFLDIENAKRNAQKKFSRERHISDDEARFDWADISNYYGMSPDSEEFPD